LLNNIDKNTVDNNNPNTAADLLIESNKLLLIDTLNWTDPPLDNYRSHFNLLQGINSDVVFDLVSFEMIAIESDWDTYNYVLVTIEHDGKSYQSTIYYSDYTKISKSFFNIINQFLTDIDSEYRLFSVTIYCRDENCDTNSYHGNLPVDPNKFGVISLTQEQAETIDNYQLIPICCNEFEILKTSEVKKVIEAYRELGLMDNMTDQEIEISITEALQKRHDNPESLLYYFDTPLYYFDMETYNFENPYEEITLELAKISTGKFKPNNIVDKYEYDQPSYYSFEMNGKQYETTLENDSDWLDLSFVILVNKALKEQGINYQFYSLESEGQFAELLFLSQEQYDEIIKRRLFNLIDVADSTAVQQGQEFEQHVIEELENK
jgi:hypothetical protein